MKRIIKLSILLVFIISTFILVEKRNCVADELLHLNNVEALANPENPVSIICYGYGSVDCPINNQKVAGVIRTFQIGI